MTDINKQIEEALKVKVKNCNNSTTIFDTRDYVLLEDAINIVKNSSRWRKVSEELPPEGEEVLFFHEDWIDEDFNPKGIRIGFYESDDYTTAKWWSIQDCYMTISHSECDDNPSFSDKTRNSIEPQRWKPID